MSQPSPRAFVARAWLEMEVGRRYAPRPSDTGPKPFTTEVIALRRALRAGSVPRSQAALQAR